MKRLLLVLAVVLVGSLGVVTAATAAGRQNQAAPAATPPPSVEAPQQIVAPVAAIDYEPAPGSDTTNPTGTATVTVQKGVFDRVTLTGPKGKAVKGAFNADRTSWTTSDRLAYGTSYTWAGSAKGVDGKSVPLEGSFSTLTPAKTVRGTLNIGDGKTVGVAAPVRVQFNGHVADRAAAEHALSVTTSVPVQGSWGWLPDEGGGSRVDWRPKEYWPSGTTVTVKAKLFGVAYGQGAYGAADVTSTFQIGRSQIVKADVNSHRMIVIRDGQQVADYPASYGLGTDPNRNTRSGIHVVSEKFTDKRMVSQQYGYDTVEKWAVRISNNGEFVHANPASAAAQGSENVTHGCVNLSIDNAKAYYDTALYGDPVEVTGTPVQLSAKDGDIWDWTLSWDKWQALSAL
ncbi:L,D-transpeptidase [Pseudonocardia xinjiangensis]|uniref:L,D-transpeptidase n=1 Tax=Pseudonocardia xinjiangensis TaxID=75289 RepID=UPI003D9436CF